MITVQQTIELVIAEVVKVDDGQPMLVALATKNASDVSILKWVTLFVYLAKRRWSSRTDLHKISFPIKVILPSGKLT